MNLGLVITNSFLSIFLISNAFAYWSAFLWTTVDPEFLLVALVLFALGLGELISSLFGVMKKRKWGVISSIALLGLIVVLLPFFALADVGGPIGGEGTEEIIALLGILIAIVLLIVNIRFSLKNWPILA